MSDFYESGVNIDDYVLLRTIIDEEISLGDKEIDELSKKISDALEIARCAEREVLELEKKRKSLSRRRRAVSEAIAKEKDIPLNDDEIAQIRFRRENVSNEIAFLTEKSGKKISIGESLVVGRESTCDFVIPDMTVSRRHAHFFRENGSWWVEDLGSKNGVKIDGKKIESNQRIRLFPSAQIRLGAAEFIFNLEFSVSSDS